MQYPEQDVVMSTTWRLSPTNPPLLPLNPAPWTNAMKQVRGARVEDIIGREGPIPMAQLEALLRARLKED